MARSAITVTVDDRVLTWKYKGIGDKLREVIKLRMARAVLNLQRWIIRNKLSGDPLNRVTGTLQRAIYATAPTDVSGGIEAVVGVDLNIAPYGRVQEVGGTINVRSYLKFSNRDRMFTVSGHTETFKRRSYLQDSLIANRANIVAQLREAVKEALQ